MKAIIVGSAASLLKRKNGPIIDSFDYIIRPVTCLLAQGYEEYVGTKTSMYWVSHQYLARLILMKEPADILCTFCTDDEYTEFFPLCKTVPFRSIKNKYFFDLFVDSVKHNIKNLMFVKNLSLSYANIELGFTHPHTWYDEHKGRVSGNTGINVIHHAVNSMRFSQVYVTGFDFYKSGFYWNPEVLRVTNRPFPYREMIWYKRLIEEKKIYEL